MRFNQSLLKNRTVVNYEGEKAYLINPEMELYTAVATTGLSDSFYESKDGRLDRIRQLVAMNDPAFTARLAVYARQSMYLRSVPVVLAVELARQFPGNPLVKTSVQSVVQRADEITEMLAYYQVANGRIGAKKLNRLSKQIQKGLAEAFNHFDAYQFAKYNRPAAVTLRDALFLVHPKAKNAAQQVVFDQIAAQSLETPYTWETELSALGQQPFENEFTRRAAFAQKWAELIDSGKLGYMALLRNLRNILESGVEERYVVKLCEQLTNEKAVRNAKQLPFRYLSAYREMKSLNASGTRQVMQALEKAVSLTTGNIKGFGRETSVVIACDVSGSMQQPVSKNSSVKLYDIGLMLGMLLQSRCENVITGMFGDVWKVVNMPAKSVLQNVDAFYRREGEVGYATNGFLVIRDLVARRKQVDKVMMFTDCQLWNSQSHNTTMKAEWQQYKKIAPQAQLYLFDLAGYGQAPLSINEQDVYLIAGWSDKIFDVLAALSNGKKALEHIKAIMI